MDKSADPLTNKIQQQIEHFDRIADRYYDARNQRNHLLLKDLMWRDFLVNKAFLRRDGLRTLEAMCGFCDGKYILERHLKITIDYTAFDYSSAVIERLQASRPELNVFRGNVTEFCCDEKFDLIILLGGLHHVPDHAKSSVRKLTESLLPGGYFLSAEPTHGNPIFKSVREYIYKRNSLFDEDTERAFSVEELKALFTNAGLILADISFPGLLSYILYYNPDAFKILNKGSSSLVRATYAFDRLWMRNWIGKVFSFATLSLWQKPT